jgi:phosphoribosylformylglycinamidine synthase
MEKILERGIDMTANCKCKWHRLFVEKKAGFNIKAQHMLQEINQVLGIAGLTEVRLLNRYDVLGLNLAEFQQAKSCVFSEPMVDLTYEDVFPIAEEERVFASEYLPGQYNQRADSAAQCIQLLNNKEKPVVVTAQVVVLKGNISEEEFERIKNYYINPIECREIPYDEFQSQEIAEETWEGETILQGFNSKTADELNSLLAELGLAMSKEDLEFCQAYFRDTEKREPTLTELRVLDTYWSDHCRHTTFSTKLNKIEFETGLYTDHIKEAYREYIEARKFVYEGQEKDICLMDMATIAMKELKKQGLLADLEESDEINACSIRLTIDRDGQDEDWLVMFKNETHNHPTEIEPFGGAATCLGGAIRDPLSGRSYVYQAMRITGSGDPRMDISQTLAGKLPQRKITQGAAAGFSSYGNQIGVATGQVKEVYHPGFMAKRMELGAVISAAPQFNVIRQKPEAGDVVILVGGRTGRDGCGGATGSSKEHTEESLFTCGAEVQKGNPPTERKIQRLFRNPKASRMIKKCNDFGAGGVSVAIGELADGLLIELDRVPTKYKGLSGTELAISESQERMAVVVSPQDADEFIGLAEEENLEATPVAWVTKEKRLSINFKGQKIVDLSRDFLDTNGVKQSIDVVVAEPEEKDDYFASVASNIVKKLPDLKEAWLENLQDLNVCSQKGLAERFDSTVGAASVLMPFGGKTQTTPSEGMVAKIPVLSGDTTTGTIMTFGYNPFLTQWSPFHGALYAVLEGVAKVVALGGDFSKIRLTLQEYFPKLGQEPGKWGMPTSALLGAYYAQKRFGIPAIGGKDSMSGTFEDLEVPPTLVSFAVCPVQVNKVVSQEFKGTNNPVIMLAVPKDSARIPDFKVAKLIYKKVHQYIQQDKVAAAHTIKTGGIGEAISMMCFGNKVGFRFAKNITEQELFLPDYGGIILELDGEMDWEEHFREVQPVLLGFTQDKPVINVNKVEISLDKAIEAWQKPLESIFPTVIKSDDSCKTIASGGITSTQGSSSSQNFKLAKPRVLIPVFPGTNCEYDSVKAFAQAGALVDVLIVKDLTPAHIEETVAEMGRRIKQAQIIMLPGGASAGDEPDGAGKYIATFFRNPHLQEVVTKFLKTTDGLMLGIGNGFQALVKLGLLPYGEIRNLDQESLTLTYNSLGRHISTMVQTKVISSLSPWLNQVKVGDIHTIPVSHGEGRLIGPEHLIEKLFVQGQVATQYVDPQGAPTMCMPYNPNGSVAAIEGITSPDGRIFGKMGHSERFGTNVAINVPGVKDQSIFKAGVAYFS